MKTFLILCSLLVSLGSDAAFYQYQRFTTNFDGTLINGNTLTNISANTPTITQTNFISGQLYTNPTTRLIYVQSSVALNTIPATAVAEMDLRVNQSGGISTNIACVAKIDSFNGFNSDLFVPGVLGAPVNPGGVWCYTNVSIGGNSATLISGTGFIIQY